MSTWLIQAVALRGSATPANTLTLTGIPSAQAFGAMQVLRPALLQGSGISSAEAFGAMVANAPIAIDLTAPLPVVPGLNGYKLVFNDEFLGTTLDIYPGDGWGGGPPPHKWLAHTPYAGDFGDAYFTGPSDLNADGPGLTPPNPYSVSGSILSITAYFDNAISHYRSGLLASVNQAGAGFAQALGYFECRTQLPPAAGVWPSFWLLGIESIQRGSRTVNECEIDIMEMYGIDMTKLHHNLHDVTPSGSNTLGPGASAVITISGATTAYHTYSALVKSDLIHCYFDGVETYTFPTFPSAFSPLYVMVDLALGSGFPIDGPSYPQTMLVDYVRVYAPPQELGFGSISATGTTSLTLTGIPSAQAFGALSVNNPISLSLTAIASLESFGVESVNAPATLVLFGLPSSEVVGNQIIGASGSSILTLAGITSAQAFGSPSISPTGSANLSLTGIATQQAFGTGTVTGVGTTNVLLSGIVSLEVLGLQRLTLSSRPARAMRIL